MKDMNISEKAKKIEMLLECIADTSILTEIAQISSLINFARRYVWAMSNVNQDKVKKLEFTNIEKY